MNDKKTNKGRIQGVKEEKGKEEEEEEGRTFTRARKLSLKNKKKKCLKRGVLKRVSDSDDFCHPSHVTRTIY